MTTYWTIWLFVFLPLSFAAGEGYALWKGKTTLSRYVWNLSMAWPPFPWLVGVLTGALATHFWWHWCPAGAISVGMLLQ